MSAFNYGVIFVTVLCTLILAGLLYLESKGYTTSNKRKRK